MRVWEPWQSRWVYFEVKLKFCNLTVTKNLMTLVKTFNFYFSSTHKMWKICSSLEAKTYEYYDVKLLAVAIFILAQFVLEPFIFFI